VADTNQSINK